MIPEAREVQLSRKDRRVLEACCRSPVTLQRDLKRVRIVLLAAAGRSTRSIAKEVGVQPRIVSLWRHRYAELGLALRLDQEKGPSTPLQTPPYHSVMIPGTRSASGPMRSPLHPMGVRILVLRLNRRYLTP